MPIISDTLEMQSIPVSDLSVNEQIDARVLRRQIRRELERWVRDRALVNQARLVCRVNLPGSDLYPGTRTVHP